MATRLPLPTLLSQSLVAFTIEFDNEAEHRLPHRTTLWGRSASAPASAPAPWLVSQVVWSNVIQFVPDDGITVDELHRRAGTARDLLAGLQRWGYVEVSGDRVVRLRRGGRMAREVWAPLAGVIQDRWRERFGAAEVDALRASLQGILRRFPGTRPQYLPVTYPTQNGRAELPETTSPGAADPPRPSADVSVELAQVLLAFTLDFERESKISLPICANPLRVLDETGVRVRDLPRCTGVSPEANSMAVGFLKRRDCVVVEADPTATRGKIIRLTAKGRGAQAKYLRVLGATEDDWRTRCGERDVADLRTALERIVGDPEEPESSPLRAGLTPYPDGWRAQVPPLRLLPHYPMVLHRGGFPDGS